MRSGGMDRPQEADDSQERLRALQLQGLLATLQVRLLYDFVSGACNSTCKEQAAMADWRDEILSGWYVLQE